MPQVEFLLTDNYLTNGTYTKHYIDVDENTSAKFTYEVKDVRSIDKRSGDYSLSISLPGTSNNNKIFSFIFEVNASLNFNPNKKCSIQVSVDTIPIITGYLQLTNVKINDSGEISYEAVVYGQYLDFVKLIGDKYLTGNDSSADDITLTELSHTFNYTNVYNSWSGDSDSTGYIYSSVNLDFAEDVPPPSIYLKRVVDAIFKQQGFTYTSDFFNSDFFKRIFIVGRDGKMNSEMATTYLESFKPAIGDRIGILDKSNQQGTFDFSYEESFGGYRKSDAIYFKNSSGVFADNYVFQPPVSGNYSFHFYLDGSISAGNLYITVARNGLTGGIQDITSSATANPVNGDTSFTVNAGTNFPYFTKTFNLDASQYYTIKYATGSSFSGYINPYSYFSIWNDSLITDMAIFLPSKLKKIDVLTSITKQFNLYIEVDKDNPRNLLIEPRDDYFAKGSIVDWSTKLDKASGYDFQILSELTAKEYDFQYTEDTDFPNTDYKDKTQESYGSFELFLDNDFTNGQTVIKSAFSPTPSYMVPGYNNVIVPYIYKQTSNGDSEEYKDFKPRLLLNSGPITIGEGKTINIFVRGQLQAVSQYPYNCMYEIPAVTGKAESDAYSLLWGNIVPQDNLSDGTIQNNLFDVYYSNEISAISSPESKMLTAKFYLQPQDIYNLRFNHKIYLEIEGSPSYWRINKIENYDAITPELTKVELIRLDDIQLTPLATKVRGTSGVINIDKASYTSNTGIVNIGDNHVQNHGVIVVGKGNTTKYGTKWSTVAGVANQIGENTVFANVTGTGNIVGSGVTSVLITGKKNNVGDNSSNVAIKGNGNSVPSSASAVNIVGSNNTVSSGVTGVSIFGDNYTATTSNSALFTKIGVNTNPSAGYHQKATGSASTDAIFRIDDTAGNAMFFVAGDGRIAVKSNSGTSTARLQIVNGVASSSGAGLNLYGTGEINMNQSGSITTSVSTSFGITNGLVLIKNTVNFNPTGVFGGTVEGSQVLVQTTFNPAAGDVLYSTIRANPTINQTGTATGVTSCFKAEPTITAAVDHRLFWGRLGTAAHWGAYISGSNSKNYLEGKLGIGTNTFAGSEKLNVSGSTILNGSVQVTGSSSYFIPPKLTSTRISALTAVSGMVVFNTTTNKLQFYDGSTWTNAEGGGCCTETRRMTVTGTQDGGNNFFTIDTPIHPGTDAVHKNGILLNSPEDYIYDGTTGFTFTIAPQPTDKIVIMGTV